MDQHAKIDFNGSRLLISARSPFARRVRVALIENGIQFNEDVFDVFHPKPELVEVNPLARVPALKLRSGQVIVDSNQILSLFYSSHPSSFMPSDPAQRAHVMNWCGIGAGLSEKVVEYFLETLRPIEKQDPEVLAENRSIFDRVVARFDREIEGKDTLSKAGLSQADLDFGCALTYLSFRYNEDWKKRYPSAASFHQKLERRPSFRATVPPPQT